MASKAESVSNNKPADNPINIKAQTFFSFFILEGGHLPFFLIFLFLRRRFLRSRIFFAIFILIFCSILSCSFDSNGNFSTGMATSLLSDGGSLLSPGGTSPTSEEALTVRATFLLIARGVWKKMLLQAFEGRLIGLTSTLEIGVGAANGGELGVREAR